MSTEDRAPGTSDAGRRRAVAEPLPILALPQASSAASVVVLCSWAALHVGSPLVASERFWSKSMTSWTAGLGTPPSLLPVTTSTFRAAGEAVFL